MRKYKRSLLMASCGFSSLTRENMTKASHILDNQVAVFEKLSIIIRLIPLDYFAI
jgi:hypothetical protein